MKRSHTQKKQVGYIEPIEEEEGESSADSESSADTGSASDNKQKKKKKQTGVAFENRIIGNAIPPEFIAAVEKGVIEGAGKGPLVRFSFRSSLAAHSNLTPPPPPPHTSDASAVG